MASLTGITWLSGELADADRLNTVVDNTSYVKSLFTTACTWTLYTTGTSWSNLGWVDISPRWETGQIIDATRLNQMYTNQNVLRSLIGDGISIWQDSNTYSGDSYYQNDTGAFGGTFFLTLNGNQIGRTLSAPSGGLHLEPPAGGFDWVAYAVKNLDISGYAEYEVITVGFNFGVVGDGNQNGMATRAVKFVKLPDMNRLSYWVTLGTTYWAPPYTTIAKDHSILNLTVTAHNDIIN